MLYQVQNQWGGSSAPWHEGGQWLFGSRTEQNIVSLNVKSDDSGKTFAGTTTYAGEGPIAFKAVQSSANHYAVQNQWGGSSAPWHPGGEWILGSRNNQNIVEAKLKSSDRGHTLEGSITYTGEGQISFKGSILGQMPAASTFLALRDFHDWVSSGGEQRAGLPTGSTAELHSSVQAVRTLSSQIAHDLERLQSEWNRLKQSKSSAISQLFLKRIAVDLYSLHSQSNVLITHSSQSKATLQGIRELLQLHIKEDRETVSTASRAMENARKSQAKARQDLRDAKRELEGDKGFLNGFLTGITFTIHNPVQDNIDKANRAVATINQQIREIKSQLNALNRSSAEMKEGHYLLDRLNNLNVSLTAYLNFLTRAETALGGAQANAEKGGKAKSDTLGAFYERRAGKEMTQLFAWIDIFQKVR